MCYIASNYITRFVGIRLTSICQYDCISLCVVFSYVVVLNATNAEQHWLDLTEKLEQQGPKRLQEAKRELNETKANCLPLLARIDERGAALLKAEEQVLSCGFE